MTWPTTPIPTTNLDAGSDQPRLARADLKQMADAVNDIQATFDINGASDGDIIVYNASTSTWEMTDGAAYIAANATPGAMDAWVAVGSGSNTSGSVATLPISEAFDPNNFITVSSNQISLTAGNYAFEAHGVILDNPDSSAATGATPIQIRNVTDSTDIGTLSSFLLDGTTAGVRPKDARSNWVFLTLASTKTISFRISTGYYYSGEQIKITKYN
jgi:hypothetical protein